MLKSFLDLSHLGPSPLSNARKPNLPVGLKVMPCGSEADINKYLSLCDGVVESWSDLLCQCFHPGKASGVFHCGLVSLHLFTPSDSQVWFQDHAFRDGVYRCKPSQEEGKDPEVSCSYHKCTHYTHIFSRILPSSSYRSHLRHCKRVTRMCLIPSNLSRVYS